MSKVQHSPPRAFSIDDSRSQSDPDLFNSSKNRELEGDRYNVKNRPKRARVNSSSSPKNDLADFKDDIMHMLTTWKSEQDNKLSKLAADMSELKRQNSNIQKSNSEIEKSIEFMSLKYEEFNKHLENLEKERSENRKCILDLEKKLQDLQGFSRSSAIEIRNVPMAENESYENLTSLVCDLGKLVKAGINPADIRDLYRLPSKPGTK